jgi:hypothetical protein
MMNTPNTPVTETLELPETVYVTRAAPADESELSALKAEGWQPFSLAPFTYESDGRYRLRREVPAIWAVAAVSRHPDEAPALDALLAEGWQPYAVNAADYFLRRLVPTREI